jgi:hypothetical protein
VGATVPAGDVAQGICAGETDLSFCFQPGGALVAQPDQQAFGILAEAVIVGQVVIPVVGTGRFL